MEIGDDGRVVDPLDMLYENLFGHMVDLRAQNLPYVYATRPFTMYFADGVEAGEGGNGPGVDCCGVTLAAVYMEFEDLLGQPFNTRGQQRLAGDCYTSWLPYEDNVGNAGFREAAAGSAHTYMRVIVGDGGAYNLIGDIRNLRRGDLAQIWWHGEEAGGNLQFVGHSVFIHDTRVDEQGRVLFQVLSAQGASDTAGVGVAGSDIDDYNGTAGRQQVALTDGRWMRFAAGDRSALHQIVPEMYAGRFRRPSPCWPVRLTGAHPLPAPRLAAGRNEVHAYNRHIETSAVGGQFPVGVNHAWHGGVHLRPGGGRPVSAVSDGVVVAARMRRTDPDLAAEAAKLGQSLPSRNFVLVRHEVDLGGERKSFYTLYMHLEGAIAGNDLLRARWLWKARTRGGPLATRLDAGEVVRLAEPIGAGECLGFTTDDALHFEVVASEDITDSHYPNKQVVTDDDTNIFLHADKLWDFVSDHIDRQGAVPDVFPELTPTDLRLFYKGATNTQREQLRGFVTKHISEWSDKVDMERNIKLPILGETEWTLDASTKQELKAMLAVYTWLDDDVAAHTQLPADHQLVHYHPIVFLVWLRMGVGAGRIDQVIQDVVSFLPGAGASAG